MNKDSMHSKRMRSYYSYTPGTDLGYRPQGRIQRRSADYRYSGLTTMNAAEPSQEVNCLTQNREQLVVYLPPYLPHNMAVKAVEDILDMKYNQIHKQVAHHVTSRKTSASSSSFSSHMADVHKRTSWQENIKGYTASERY